MSMPEILEENMTGEQKLLWGLNSLSAQVNEMKSQQSKHHKVLIEGNGELPLVEQVRNLNTFVASVRYWMKFLIGALLLQTITIASTAILYLIKLAPVLEQISANNP